MGASTAYHLSTYGHLKTLLLEREEFFGTGATGRCAGGVRYQFATEINIRLSLKSLPMLERFREEIGQDVNYRKIGYLFLLTNQEDLRIFSQVVDLQNRLGAQTEWLDCDEIQKRLPVICVKDVIAGSYNARDGLVDPYSVVMGYINAAQRSGCRAYSSVNVTGIKVNSGKVVGVEINERSIAAPVVVDATGPWASLTSRMAGIHVPVTPLRRQWLTTNAIPELPKDFPFVIDFAQSLYFHPEGPGLLTGMSNPLETPGYDQRVDPEWELVHLEAAINRLPLL